ncbi:MAG TPA: glycosyltransferase [Dehalococcoidia bacterium]|nr:glycosyltransferase [Dehalococcoidia bacterium]
MATIVDIHGEAATLDYKNFSLAVSCDMKPRVAFIVPSYNYGRFLAQAVDSLLSQTFVDMEIIVIDDGSTDETAEVLKRYEADGRIRIVRHAQNQGNIRTFNEGIELAQGDFVGILASDDYFQRVDAVERAIALMDAHADVGFVYFAQTVVDEAGQPISICQPAPGDYVRGGLEEFADQAFGVSIDGSGLIIRRACHSEVGVYDARYPHVADWDLWFRIMMCYSVGYVADLMVAKRAHSANMSHTMISARQAVEEKRDVIRKAFDALPHNAPQYLLRNRGGAIDRMLLNECYCNRCLGRVRRGWQSLLQAVLVSPLLFIKGAFYVELGRLGLQTVLGQKLYGNLAVWRRKAWQGA